jgi:hypothetical protein
MDMRGSIGNPEKLSVTRITYNLMQIHHLGIQPFKTCFLEELPDKAQECI